MLLPPIEGWDLRCRHHQQALAEVWQVPETAAEARQAPRQPQQQRQGWPLQVLEPHWPGAEPLPGLARAPVLQLPPLGQLAVAHQQVLEPRVLLLQGLLPQPVLALPRLLPLELLHYFFSLKLLILLFRCLLLQAVILRYNPIIAVFLSYPFRF